MERKKLMGRLCLPFCPFLFSFVFGISKWGRPQKKHDWPRNKGFWVLFMAKVATPGRVYAF